MWKFQVSVSKLTERISNHVSWIGRDGEKGSFICSVIHRVLGEIFSGQSGSRRGGRDVKVSSTKNTCQVQLNGIKCLEITWLLVYLSTILFLYILIKKKIVCISISWSSYHWRNTKKEPWFQWWVKKKLSSSGVTQGRNSEEAFILWAFLGLFCFCAAWRSMLAFLSLTLVLIRGHLTRLLSNASTCYDVISPASTTGTRKDYTNSLIIYRVK